MKLLANENFPLKSILYLRSKGFDISSIGTDNPSIQDDIVMNIAISESRTILTFDRDYGELIFKHNYRPQRGVIYLRLDEYKADEPGKMIEEIINKKEFDFNNALTVLDRNGIRQRKY
jgi:predicted nuclease of predicted toxin-antitoxin system